MKSSSNYGMFSYIIKEGEETNTLTLTKIKRTHGALAVK